MHPDSTERDSEATREFELEYRRELFWIAADKVRAQVKAKLGKRSV